MTQNAVVEKVIDSIERSAEKAFASEASAFKDELLRVNGNVKIIQTQSAFSNFCSRNLEILPKEVIFELGEINQLIKNL